MIMRLCYKGSTRFVQFKVILYIYDSHICHNLAVLTVTYNGFI